MSADRLATAALSVLLVAVGGLAWWLQVQPRLAVDPSALATLPRQVAGYAAEDIPLEQTVEAVLRADFNLQRAYLSPSGQIVWLYLGYYGTSRGGRPEHTPRGCYTGAGWGIADSQRLRVDPEGRLRVNEYLVESEGARRLVHFWYRSWRRTGMLGGLDQNWDRLVGRLTARRADGALVRISTPIEDGDVVGARSRLLGFAARLDPLLAERWPTERRVDTALQEDAASGRAG